MQIKNLSFFLLTGILLISLFIGGCKKEISQEFPNILWLTSEDNSPFLGCYGDDFATTPNLDRLASQGFLYTHAYANAPVCAPARNTIITGVYASSNGNQHMRSFYKKGNEVRFSPQFLREIGYYCTNNAKEDYNIDKSQTQDIWDESSKNAHYKNRKPGQPFFAVFNTSISHESRIHRSIPTEELRHNPKDVKLPPYHPDTPEMRHDWAQYYDKVEDMDTWVGKKLQELEDAGLAKNTIVFYYSDHGGVLGRSKRFVYESGTWVPFIVRIPKKYKHLFPAKETGSKVDRLISFVDLAPTLLSIAGITIPDYMQGNAFLGKQKTEDQEYEYMFRGRMDERYDMSRAVRDKKFRYIRNYMPHRIYGLHHNYLWRAPSMRSWEQAYLNGECNEIQSIFWHTKPPEELYDTESAPWEVNNLAGNPEYEGVLKKMRKANKEWVTRIYDTGFIPEADLERRAGEIPYYDYMRSGEVPVEEIVEAADIATLCGEENLEKCIAYLKNEDSAIRYWGATGLLIIGERASGAVQQLEEALNDESPNVVVVAAEALYKLGKKREGEDALLKTLDYPLEKARCFALNAVDCASIYNKEIQKKLTQMVSDVDPKDRSKYDIRIARWLLDKWSKEKNTN